MSAARSFAGKEDGTPFCEAPSWPFRATSHVPWLVLLIACSQYSASCIPAAFARNFRHAEVTFNAVRPVNNAENKPYAVVVTEFFHHGEIDPKGAKLLVVAANNEAVPTRILQLGPGDYCRLAFQTIPRQTRYDVFYGGEEPPRNVPPWTNRDGLLLETREYKHCNPNSLEAVREAFDSARPIGAGYVEGVHHSSNPYTLKAEPFLSRYSGFLNIETAGTYGFLTTSRDASFLLINDKLVVAAPGLHGPMRHARPGSRKDIQLAPGAHKFDYYHLAAGPEAVMAAAWEVNPLEEKPKPAAIPPSVFRTEQIGTLPAEVVTTRTLKSVPDFLVAVVGDVPLPDNPDPLVGVSFRNTSPQSLMAAGNVHWDFGDGQSSSEVNPNHVYLRPGLYEVTLTIRRLGRDLSTTNRIYIDRPLLTHRDEKKFHKLDDYLTIVRAYDPKVLDAASLRQLVEAYDAKAASMESLEPQAETPEEEETQPPRPEPASPGGRRSPADPEPAEETTLKYIEQAVQAGQVAFLDPGSKAAGDDDLLKLARIVAPMARDRLARSETAFQIWEGASRKVGSPEGKAECFVEAADIAINDLLKPAAMKTVLEAATRNLADTNTGRLAARLACIWGDFHAATGDGLAAREAYVKAERIAGQDRRYIERTAWRGAHSRSVEAFLRDNDYHRAIGQIRLWQTEFPTERIDGFLTLMYAKYWANLEQWDQAIAQAEQLQAVNPDSPYVDQILVLAAECEVKRKRPDRAIATLRSLLNEYPGSPLVPEVKKTLASLEAGEADTKRK